MRKLRGTLCGVLAVAVLLRAASGEVCNIRVTTDATPDYSDLPSMLHSITAKWLTTKEKCWALFYWNHIGRRQTAPIVLHGTELTDPIRQFNDYGYTMCSTISGVNCALWHNLGLQARFWDISLHTVPEVFYDGRWHMYDNSMSALYTLCDGQTIAGVEEIGKEGQCEASAGKSERGHVAKYHCLYATGPNGFLTGADTQRSLEEEVDCFDTDGLKYRYYYFNWDYGHRYILNLRPKETYTRFYTNSGGSPEFYVANEGKDPDGPDGRYHLRGNGVWHFRPDLKAPDYAKQMHRALNINAGASGLSPVRTGEAAEAIFKVEGANVITSQKIAANFVSQTENDRASIAVSINNGLYWTTVWSMKNGDTQASIDLLEQVNGAYEVLLKIHMMASQPHSLVLTDLGIETRTMLNAKTQPRLNLGKNTVYIGTGEQTESIVLWPELQAGKYKRDIVEEKNIGSTPTNIGYQGTIYPAKAVEDAFLIYRVEAPGNLSRVSFGGRFYNRASGSHIDLLYSLDAGKTWHPVWSLRRTRPPWDVVHYESVNIPPDHRSVWLKYLLKTSDPSPSGCSIYAVRIEANYVPADATFHPLQVTFDWSERQKDGSTLERRHTQSVPRVPFKYAINVGGEDHPMMHSLRVNLQGALEQATEGYSDGKDAGGDKFIPKWLTCGRNLALNKSYSFSVPSATNWGAGDSDGKKLTRGACGPSYAGGSSYRAGALWMENDNPVIILDLGAPAACASFGLNFHGYPWWDALKGEIRDKVEVFTSLDGREYHSQGFLKTELRWTDLPINYMWTDEETMTSGTFRCVPHQRVTARYVQYRVSNARAFDCAGIEVLDAITFEPFDPRLAFPDEAGPITALAPVDDGLDRSEIRRTNR